MPSQVQSARHTPVARRDNAGSGATPAPELNGLAFPVPQLPPVRDIQHEETVPPQRLSAMPRRPDWVNQQAYRCETQSQVSRYVLTFPVTLTVLFMDHLLARFVVSDPGNNCMTAETMSSRAPLQRVNHNVGGRSGSRRESDNEDEKRDPRLMDKEKQLGKVGLTPA